MGPSINLGLSPSSGLIGWPVLPHGQGSFYNIFGVTIRNPISANRPNSYSAVSPNNGNIISAHGHFDFTAGLIRYGIYAANYTTNTNSLIQNAGGVGIFNRTLLSPIPVSAGEEIGIYIEDTAGPGNLAPTGTLARAFMLEGCLILQ